jgi:hypothetical protein
VLARLGIENELYYRWLGTRNVKTNDD